VIEMETKIYHFVDVSKDDFHDLIALRLAVFVVEQNCPYIDLDGKDKQAHHLIIKNDEGKVIGTARILSPGAVYAEASIGRVVSHPEYRDKKIGHLIMKEAMCFVEKFMDNSDIRISAQSHLCGFYEQYGFVKTGKEYLEDGIPHSEMLFKSNEL